MKLWRSHRKSILLFLVLFALFITNAFHEKYPDEFDSIVGGRYIAEGKVPYRDWFQHHQPGAYVMAAAILPFTGPSFVKFRIGWEAVLYLILVSSYILLRSRLPKRDLTFYVVLLFVIALSGTYFWGHMLLADTLAGYFILPAFALLTLKEIYREKFTGTDLFIVGVYAFLSWFTSMTYIFIVAALSVYAMYRYGTSEKDGAWRRLIRGGAVLAVPYLLFGLYILFTGSLADYYWANITYNTEFYIYNYPRVPGQPINPVRYAAVIVDRFLNNYLPALWGVIRLPVNDPVQVTLAFSWAVLLGLMIVSGKYLFLLLLLITLVFSNARSNPQTIRETDYQAFVYIITGMFSGLFAVSFLRETLNHGKPALAKAAAQTVMYLVLLIMWIATPLFFAMKMEQKFFPKYMGTAPIIYSRPQIARFVNALTERDDYAYIGPFEFEELLYLEAKMPSKYHWFLDHAARSKIKDELIADLTINRPKIIVFKRNYTPWGGDASTYNWWMQEFLDKEYFRIFTLNGTLSGRQYRWKIANTENFDIDGTFHFDNRRREEIISDLLRLGYIEETEASK